MKPVSDVFCSSAPRSSLITFLLLLPVFFWTPHQELKIQLWEYDDWTMYDDKTPWWRHPIRRPLTIWRNLTRDLMNPRLEETLKNHLSPLGKGLFFFHSPLAPLDPPSVPPLPTCRPNKPVELTAGVKGGGQGERGELPLLASWRLQSFFCNQSSPTRRWHPTRRQWWSDNIRQNRHFPTKTSNFRTSNFLSNTHTLWR